jgi:xanthine dehydrogenase YagS FAD-binding subunit
MQTYSYLQAPDLARAVQLSALPGHWPIAGGTELVNWMKEGIVRPVAIVDIMRLAGLERIEAGPGELRLGALSRMSDVAAHAGVRSGWPAIAQALEKSASPQLRNMATMGGNLLQRTRCPYFRAEVELPCNKRVAGSGCSARAGEDRGMALFGWSEACVATHASDVAVAFAALDAVLDVQGPAGARQVALNDLYRAPGATPEVETDLAPGEIVTAIRVPASATAQASAYLKVRERASYEFALVSAAAGVELSGGRIARARLALGGVAYKPWRLSPAAEAALEGVPIDDAVRLHAALRPAFADARPLKHNSFKIELARRAAVRALQNAGGVA